MGLGDYSSSDEEMDVQSEKVAPTPLPAPTKGLPAGECKGYWGEVEKKYG